MNERRAAWTFVAPSLVVIGGFFLVPVAAAFVLSLTDFDLYALASLDNLRFVWLGRWPGWTSRAPSGSSPTGRRPRRLPKSRT